MTFETLYKRTKTGAIQYWKISVVANCIRKESGQLGTSNPLIHQELVEGKNIGKSNETNPELQAELQARSDWKKKRDEGYKGLSDLDELKADRLYTTSDPADLKELLEKFLPQFNTDASGNVKPMLAPTKCWSPSPKNRYPMIIEKKFDGNRSMMVIKSEDDIQFLSRSGKPHEHLNHLVNAVWLALGKISIHYPVILDGEVYKHGWTLEEINQAIKKFRPGITEQLEFIVYDLPLHTGPQEERTVAVSSIIQDMADPLIKSSDWVMVADDANVKVMHDMFVEDGYEGAILKDPNGFYQQGQRSRYWTKVKMFDETEFTVIGHELGQRGIEDLMFVCDSPGGPFEVKLSGSRESKELIWNEYIVPSKLHGMQFTVKHFGYTKYNKPFIPTGKSLRINT